MIASPEDARLFFDRWKEDRAAAESPPVGVLFVLRRRRNLTDFTSETLELGGDSWKFTIPLEGVNFSFSDPREIPVASVRESETAQYEFGIALQLPNGDQLVIMELKASSQPASESDE